MRHLVSERGLGLAILIFALGMSLFVQTSIFKQPVLISEKSLLLLMCSIGLMVGSLFFAVRSIKKE